MADGQSNAAICYVRRVAYLLERDRMADGQLLDRFLSQRDEAAFEVLMRRHGPMVLGVCRRVLANPHDVEDAFQATFLVLVRKAASIQNRELVGNWLYGAAYRAALEAKAARRRLRERQVNPMPEPAAPTEAMWEDLGPVLDRELSRLPDKFRVPVVLCDLQGRTRREVAQQLGIPEGTLSGRLTTARRRLARQLTRHGVTLSSVGLATLLSESAVSACVPVSLATTTLTAISAVMTGTVAAVGAVPHRVAALTDGVMKTMLLAKLKSMAIVVLAVSLCGGGTLLTYQTLGAEERKTIQHPSQPVPADDKAAEKDKEKKEEQPKPEAKTNGYLGVVLAGDDDKKQTLIHQVFPDSPALKAGIKSGDVRLKVGDTVVMGPMEAINLLKDTKPGDQVKFVFKQDNKETKLTITLGKWPAKIKVPTEAIPQEDSKDEQPAAFLGLILRDDGDSGVVVIHQVTAESPAAKAGVKADDVLLQFGETKAKASGDVVKGMAKLKPGDKVTLRIKRGDKEMDVTITAGKRPPDFEKM
jgi:RNA polymerase sigma factor (sigma-70 family)